MYKNQDDLSSASNQRGKTAHTDPPTEGLPGSTPPSQIDRAKPDAISPTQVFIITITAIFLAEVLAMIVIYYIPPLPYWLDTLLDGLIMIVIIFPIVYYLLFRSLLIQIGERKRGEALLGKVLENLPVGVWIVDPNGRIIHGNPASQAIWGGARYVGIEQYGDYKGWWADSGKRVERHEWAAVRAIKHKETILNEEIEIEGFDNQHKIIFNSAVPILDEQDDLQGVIIVNQDITRQREAQQALIQSNELMERYFSSIDTLIAYMDRNFNFIRVNDTYARAGGHPPEFFIGKNHFELYPNEENQAIFQHVAETGEPFSVIEKPFEYAEYPERGVTYWDWSLQPVKSGNGTVEGLVLSLVDVTERKRAEIKLERRNQELRELSSAERHQRELAESLVQATLTLNTSLELEQVLSSIMEQIRKAVPFQGADIILVEGGVFRVASYLGFEGYPESIPIMGKSYFLADFPLLQQVYTTHQAVKIDHVLEHPDWRGVPGMEWVRSYLAVPLEVEGEVIGIINLTSALPGNFTQEAADRLLAFAAPAALALHNARLFKAESSARQFAETLSAAAQELALTLDLEHVIHTLLDRIQMFVPATTAGVTLLEDEEHLTLRASWGYGRWSDQEKSISFPIDSITDSVIHRVMAARKSLVLPNPALSPGGNGAPGDEQIRTWLIAPMISRDKVIGLVEIGKSGDEGFNPEQIRLVEALVGQAGVAIQNAWLFQQVRASSERLQSLARKLVEIQEKERYHIARELHDEAGQALSSLKLALGRLGSDPNCPAHFQEKLEELKQSVDIVLEELHRLAMDLRPVALDHLGLVAALEQYAKNLTSEGLSVKFKTVGFEGSRLPGDVETSLYRIVQEALTNVVRHSKAKNVGILLERSEGSVKVFVEDDGIGLAPDVLNTTDRLGLVGMRERAEMFGGSLTIETAPGKGTSIIVEVPDVHTHFDRG